jgi:hypothetical protein
VAPVEDEVIQFAIDYFSAADVSVSVGTGLRSVHAKTLEVGPS